jgi:hypothetical protein
VHPPLGDEAKAFHQWRIRLQPRTNEFLVYIDDYVVAQGSAPSLGGEVQWRIGRKLAGREGAEAEGGIVLARARAVEEKRDIPWQGIMFRARDWSALSEAAYKSILTEFDPAEGNVVAPRAWKVSSQRQNITTSIKVASAGTPEKTFFVSGLVGLSPWEPAVSKADLACGRWFAQGEGGSCVLSGRQAAAMGIDPGKVTGSPEGAPAVVVHGERLAVVGITDDRTFAGKADIDTEELSPVDFTQESWQKHQGRETESTTFYRYTHISNLNVLWVPFDYLMERGGTLRSVAVKPIRPIKDLVTNDLLQRLEVPIFVAEKQKVTFQSSVSRSPIAEMRNLIVPVLIAALIVLNTMLGAVYEREREIWIFGSLGLAPVHIASLFIAESCVYATVATVFGYVAGQVSAKLITVTGLLPGLNLNYSSKSAVFSAAFLIGVVLASTIYPARRAAQTSVPDVERIWKFPEAHGDRLEFEFPFTMSGDQSMGMTQHLKKFFEDHSNQSVGEFYTADVRFEAREPSGAPAPADSPQKGKHGCRLTSMVWIAPFDFGISQRLTLETIPTEDRDIYEARMVLERASGESTAWVKMNHRFLRGLRKQFLIWRLYTAEERTYYANLARAELGLPPVEMAGATSAAGPAGAAAVEA